MTPEEAYEEALRRIREAERTGALELDLSGWNRTAQKYTGLETLTRLPPELERLTSIQSLDLSWCEQLSGDLSLLSHLTSLQKLRFLGCEKLSGDLCSLAGLTSLQSLDISRSHGSRIVAPAVCRVSRLRCASATSANGIRLRPRFGIIRLGTPMAAVLPNRSKDPSILDLSRACQCISRLLSRFCL
jgi:hypothetical protein